MEGLHVNTKREHQRAHTIKRMEERYDITISHAQYDALCARVARGDAFYVSKMSNDASKIPDRIQR